MNPPRVLFLGRTTLDALYRLDRLPDEDTKVFARQFQAAPGGPALTAAITHALLGGQSMFVSAVGGGPWAAPVRAELARHCISLLDLAAGTAYETPLTTVLVSAANSSRTIVNPPASTLRLPPLAARWETAVPASWGAIPPVVLCDGFYLEESLALLTACRDTGAALCLDGGSWKPGTAELAPLLTAAICSERFAIPAQPGPGQPDHGHGGARTRSSPGLRPKAFPISPSPEAPAPSEAGTTAATSRSRWKESTSPTPSAPETSYTEPSATSTPTIPNSSPPCAALPPSPPSPASPSARRPGQHNNHHPANPLTNI
jgi:hypothetical protein